MIRRVTVVTAPPQLGWLAPPPVQVTWKHSEPQIQSPKSQWRWNPAMLARQSYAFPAPTLQVRTLTPPSKPTPVPTPHRPTLSDFPFIVFRLTPVPARTIETMLPRPPVRHDSRPGWLDAQRSFYFMPVVTPPVDISALSETAPLIPYRPGRQNLGTHIPLSVVFPLPAPVAYSQWSSQVFDYTHHRPRFVRQIIDNPQTWAAPNASLLWARWSSYKFDRSIVTPRFVRQIIDNPLEFAAPNPSLAWTWIATLNIPHRPHAVKAMWQSTFTHELGQFVRGTTSPARVSITLQDTSVITITLIEEILR